MMWFIKHISNFLVWITISFKTLLTSSPFGLKNSENRIQNFKKDTEFIDLLRWFNVPVPTIILGNKSDLANKRVVDSYEAERLAESYHAVSDNIQSGYKRISGHVFHF